MIALKLNHDCVRGLLLALEEKLITDDNGIPQGLTLYNLMKSEPMSKYPQNEVVYTTQRLVEAGFIAANLKYTGDGLYVSFYKHITYSGHQHLDNIRDSRVWESVKKGLSKAGGSAGFSLIGKLAEIVILRFFGYE